MSRCKAALLLAVGLGASYAHLTAATAGASDAFYQAIRLNDLSRLEQLIAAGNDVDVRSDQESRRRWMRRRSAPSRR
jgi:hypothetical protein